MSETSFKRLKFTRYIRYEISLTFLRPIFIKIAHDNWCPKQLSKSSSLLWYVQFAISLTFLRSIFMKITENINVLPTVVVDFLIKIARRYFFFFAFIKLLILSSLGYGSTADILQHAYTGIYGLLRFCVNHGRKFQSEAVYLHPFLCNYRLHDIQLTYIIKSWQVTW